MLQQATVAVAPPHQYHPKKSFNRKIVYRHIQIKQMNAKTKAKLEIFIGNYQNTHK